MKTTFALYFANRGFFPGESIATTRAEMIQAVTGAGYDVLVMDETLTRYGAVETLAEGKIYADFLDSHRGEYQGIILCLPNFGDENGASEAFKHVDVPIRYRPIPTIRRRWTLLTVGTPCAAISPCATYCGS